MVMPYRHVKDLSKITPAEYAEMMQLASITVKALEKTMHPQGHNLGMNLGAAAGAGILNHLHLHVVPRWIGDTNFMPVLDHTKVMVEYLNETYDRLAPVIHRLAKK
jgi:ATP adenylyltransferase